MRKKSKKHLLYCTMADKSLIKVTYSEHDAAPTENETLVVIRDMKLKDVSDCFNLGKKLFSFSSSLSRTFDRFVVIEAYSSEPEFCLVAVCGETIVGFIVGFTLTKEFPIGYINWVAVDPEFQVSLKGFFHQVLIFSSDLVK